MKRLLIQPIEFISLSPIIQADQRNEAENFKFETENKT